VFDGGESARLAVAAQRKAYVHLVRGRLTVNGTALTGGDALLLQQEAETEITLGDGKDAEVLVFDLAQ